jgi:ribA/ribD-fused uncharacterized protein
VYSLSTLISQYNSGERLKYVFFWGHTPSKGQEVGPFCFSQWYPAEFVVDGVNYLTAEHWMMAQKALLFGDKEIEEKIVQASKPALVKDLGRQIRNFNNEVWEKNRFDIVVNGNYHKFSQHEDLKEYLLSASDRILVEASPVDNIWGIGLAKDAAGIENPSTWKGLNLLGFALMEARRKLLLEKYSQIDYDKKVAVLYRPVGAQELELIKQSNYKVFPPRLPEQPIFYPVLNEEYAVQITREWNLPAKGCGYVTKFEVDLDYFTDFELHNVGGDIHNELWIPAEELDNFNRHILGEIKVIHEF